MKSIVFFLGFISIPYMEHIDIYFNQFSSFGFAHCFVFLTVNSAAVNNLIHSHFSRILSICVV